MGLSENRRARSYMMLGAVMRYAFTIRAYEFRKLFEHVTEFSVV